MKLLLLACVFILKSMLVTPTSRFRQTTPVKPSHPVVEYSFSCGPNGKTNVNTSSPVLGDLSGIESAHCNPLDNGISSNYLLQSSLTVATMRQSFLQSNATGLAVELWIKPRISKHLSHSFQPIVAVASDYYQANDIFECHLTAFAIGLRGDLVEIRYVDNDPYKSCRILLVRQRPLSNDELSQIILTLHDGQTNVYINGTPTIEGAPNSFMANLTMWNGDSTLRLLSNHQPSPAEAYSGVLYQICIYDQGYAVEQIQLAYQQRLQVFEDDFVNREPLRLLASAKSSTVIQGQSSLIQIGGFNQSMPEYDVWIEVLVLPQHGILLSEEGPIRESGTKLPFQGSVSELSFFYRPWSEDFFTSPGTSSNGQDLNLSPDVVEFRLLAVGINDGALMGWSDPVQKDIHVQHVNRPPVLEINKTARVPTKQPFDAGGYPIAYLDGVQLKDPDKNVDRVRIDVWTQNGSLVLTEYADFADFAPRKNRSYPDWQCHGNPGGSQNMTFLAEPDSATNILSSLKYEGFFWNQEDAIVIRIYDGSGNACLDEDEHSQGTIHDGCYEIIAQVKVPPISMTEEEFQLKDISFVQVSFWLLVLIPILAFLYVVQWSRSFINSCRKGSGVGVDGSVGDEISIDEIDGDTEHS